MPLTETQKHDVILYLGYSGKTLIPNSVDYNTSVATALTSLNSCVEAQVTTYLGQIADLQTKLVAATGRMMAKKVGDIELDTDEQQNLTKARKRLVRELSQLLGLPVRGATGLNIGVII